MQWVMGFSPTGFTLPLVTYYLLMTMSLISFPKSSSSFSPHGLNSSFVSCWPFPSSPLTLITPHETKRGSSHLFSQSLLTLLLLMMFDTLIVTLKHEMNQMKSTQKFSNRFLTFSSFLSHLTLHTLCSSFPQLPFPISPFPSSHCNILFPESFLISSSSWYFSPTTHHWCSTALNCATKTAVTTATIISVSLAFSSSLPFIKLNDDFAPVHHHHESKTQGRLYEYEKVRWRLLS